MSRKRSISSVLDDDDEPSSSRQPSRRNRSISSIINEETTPSVEPSYNVRRWVICNCTDCNGQLVDSRTKAIHESRHQGHQDSQGTFTGEFQQLELDDEDSASDPERYTIECIEEGAEFLVERSSNNGDDDDDEDEETEFAIKQTSNDEKAEDDEYQTDDEFSFLPRQRVRKHINRPESTMKISDDDPDPGNDPSESSEYTTEEDIYSNASQSENEPDDNGRVSESFEDYSAPDYESFQDSAGLESTIDGRFLWILLWILNFRTRFNITETATEALIKFMKLVLNEIGGDEFKDFPDSLYLTRKVLGLKDKFHSFVPCPKCHKLYQKYEVVNFQQGSDPAVTSGIL